MRGESRLQDQCAWYGLSYLIDTTLGLVLAIWLLHLQSYLANRFHWDSLKQTGVYVGEDAWSHWMLQCLSWLFILTIVKFIIYIFMWSCSTWLAIFGGLIFKPLQGNIRFELLFVMIFFPGFLNVIYFWIADSYLKAGKDHAGAHETSSADSKQQHLMASDQPIEAIPVRKQPGVARAAPTWATLEMTTPAAAVAQARAIATAMANQVYPSKSAPSTAVPSQTESKDNSQSGATV
jgi:STIMATE family